MANFDFKKITLPNGDVGTVTDVTAQNAAADAADAAGQLNTNLNNNTYSFLTYKDNTHTEAQIKAFTSAKVGDFYIASDTGTAYVCIKAVSGTASASSWEKAGSSTDVSKFVIAEDYDGTGTTTTVAETFDGHTIEEFTLKTDIVNNLNSASTTSPLAAAQGKILGDSIVAVEMTANDASEKVTSLETTVNTLSSDVSTAKSNISTAQSDITTLKSGKLAVSGGTMTGVLTAQNNTSYTTKQVRNIFISTSSPSGGTSGDIWIKYTN